MEMENSGASLVPQVFCHYNHYVLCKNPKTVDRYSAMVVDFGVTKVIVEEPAECTGCKYYEQKATSKDVKSFLDVIGGDLDPDLLNLIQKHQDDILG